MISKWKCLREVADAQLAAIDANKEAQAQANEDLAQARAEADQRMIEATERAAQTLASAYSAGSAAAGQAIEENIPDEVQTVVDIEDRATLKARLIKEAIDRIEDKTVTITIEEELRTRGAGASGGGATTPGIQSSPDPNQPAPNVSNRVTQSPRAATNAGNTFHVNITMPASANPAQAQAAGREAANSFMTQLRQMGGGGSMSCNYDLGLFRFGAYVFNYGLNTSRLTGGIFAPVMPLVNGSSYEADMPAFRTVPYILTAEKHVLAENDPSNELKNMTNALLGYIGTRNRLYRRRSDGQVEHVNATLLDVNFIDRPGATTFREFRATFRVKDEVWRGKPYNMGFAEGGGVPATKTWTLDDGSHFDSGLYFDPAVTEIALSNGLNEFTLTNNGNATMRNAIFTIDATTQIDGFTLVKSGETYIQFGATIGAGEQMVVDCGALTVQVDGDSAYDVTYGGNAPALDPDTDHQISDWLHLTPGDNTLKILLNSGGGTFSPYYYDTWF